MYQVMNCRAGVLAVFAFAVFRELGAAASLCVKVEDPGNLPLPDASVSAVNLNTAKLYTGRTGREGRVCLSGVPEGLYAVEVGLAGFLNVRYYPVRIAPVATHELRFLLPFGEITEGTVAQEATLSGTLTQEGAPVQNASICVLTAQAGSVVKCTSTNDLGEYALIVPTGLYSVELRLPNGSVRRKRLDVSRPGFHRNVVGLDPGSQAVVR